MESHRKRDAVETHDRSHSGVYKSITPHLLSKLRKDRSAAATRVALFRPQIVERRRSDGDEELSWRALQEIDAAHEELRCAEEEVYALADEVIATRAELDAERRIYRELFDLAPEAYVVTSDKGTIVQANQAAGRLFNRDPAFLLGKPVATLIERDDRPEVFDMLSTMGANILRTELRIQLQSSDRSLCVGVSAQRGMFAGNSGCVRWLFRAADDDEEATRRRRVENDLRNRVRELEASQRALGHLLEREQKASQEAEQRDRLKGLALAAVAHEIRGPLGAMAGWLHMLDKEGMGAEVRKRAALSMTRSVRALARLIDDVVEHARVENHKIRLDTVTINLVRLVAEVAEDMRPLAGLKKLHLELSATPHSIVIHGDPWRLQQVFRNLLGNAIKFTPEGGTIRVTTAVAGLHAKVAISDTGCGIGPRDLGEIFKPFSQIGEPRKGNDGLGLGLSIAHRLVELHDGTLEAQSEGRDLGSTFTASLPLAEASGP
jgi:PAS domain S-box-containing protein